MCKVIKTNNYINQTRCDNTDRLAVERWLIEAANVIGYLIDVITAAATRFY